jgi:hypothetical protein
MEIDRTTKDLADTEAYSDVQYPDIPGVPSRIVKICILQQLVRPEQRNGRVWFSPREILILKTIHSMVLGYKIEAELKRSFRKAKIETTFRSTIPINMSKGGVLTKIAVELSTDSQI